MVTERVKTMKISGKCLVEVEAALERYEEEVGGTRLARNPKHTYLPHAETFMRWLRRGMTSSQMGSGVDER